MSAVQGGDEALRRKQVKRALVASTVGTSIEWYDFFLYGTAAALVFPDLFFPDSSHYAGVLASFAIYAVGFAARPVGAAIFGHWGDRIGRKATLISTLLLMGIASFLIGVLPTFATIGIWAPVLLVVLRILQGIGVGGEWGGSITLSMEWGNQRRRGLVASWPQVGVPIGLLLVDRRGLAVQPHDGRLVRHVGLADPVPAQPPARRPGPVDPAGRARVADVQARGRERDGRAPAGGAR